MFQLQKRKISLHLSTKMTFISTGRHLLITSLGVFTAFLWRDAIYGSIETFRDFLKSHMSPTWASSRFPELVDLFFRMFMASVTTVVVVIIYNNLQKSPVAKKDEEPQNNPSPSSP